MTIPGWVKPAFWGIVVGAIATMIIGFTWGGWVTASTADETVQAQVEDKLIQSMVPLCVAKAEKNPKKLKELNKTDSWERSEFVIDAGWVANVSETYREDVADACAETAVEGMKEEPES